MRAKQHPLYACYKSMIGRCSYPTNGAYEHYGARGITVCKRWRESFWNFIADMGERPAGTSLDRINNDGNYEPGNCRWAIQKEQHKNRRNTVKLMIEGKEYLACELAEKSTLKSDTIVARARKGLTLAEVLDPGRRVFYEGLKKSPNFGKTHCNFGHEYTEENTYWTPAGYRQCRICNKRRESIRVR